MAYSNIDNLALGKLLQIVFTNSVRNQISQDFRDFEMVKRAKVGKSLARELRFMFKSGYGPSSIQYRDPGTSNRAFPTNRPVSLNEYTAKFKEINATLEAEYGVWSRAMASPEKYGDPLVEETTSKASAAKRRIAADFYADGTGVIGTIASQALSSGLPVVTLNLGNTARGHVGFFEFEDHLVHRAANGGAGTAVTVTTGTFDYWRVRDKSRENGTATLVPVNTLGNETTVTAWTPTAGEVFYRNGQPTIPDLTSISDYGTVTEVIAGLESLTAADGRVIHGITMTGATAGSRLDAGANPIDVKYIQKAMSKTKNVVGQDRYTWKMMSMASETLDSLIESRETDRRFQSVQDGARGVTKFMYIHQNDSLECYTSEYVPPKRIYILPETKASEKVIEFHGTDFESVKAPNGDDWRLKATSNGYVNTMQSFLQAVGVIICNHPAAIAVIHNFTNT